MQLYAVPYRIYILREAISLAKAHKQVNVMSGTWYKGMTMQVSALVFHSLNGG